MSRNNYLLISQQDSFARAVLPGVFSQQANLTMASSPFDALALLDKAQMDALLVAFDDDEDAAVMCKTLRRRSNLPIVMVVNSTTRNQVTRGYMMGADAHVEIPCDPRIFRARVEAVMRMRERRPEASVSQN
jgi:DNA-binding response OmpR family regulator